MSGAPGYRIETAVDLGIIRMIMIGFWDDANVTAFPKDLDLAMRKLADAGVRDGEYLYFVDYTDSGIQSSAITVRFQRLVEHAGSRARRIATISPTTLLKMQLNRIVSEERYPTFGGGQEAEAEAWLLSGEMS